MARTAVALAALALLAALLTASPAGPMATAAAKKLGPSVSIVSPAKDQLVRNGRVRLVIRTRNGARPTRVDVDGVNVTRFLRAGAGGTYSARLSLGRGLHYGVNDAFVRARGKDPSGTFDHTRFMVAQRDDSLLKLTELRTDLPDTPARVSVRLAKGTSVRAYVNGQRVDRAFRREGKLLVGRLGANDGLHFGRNFVQILVHKTHSYRRRSSFDVESGTVNIDRDGPIAGAGEDRTITQNNFAQLDGRSTKLPPGSGRRVFSWKVTSAPKGSKAKLRNASDSRPGLVPDVPGHYKVRVRVRGKGKRAGHGVASGIGAAADTSQTEAANDTATLTVPPDIPPAGLRLDTQTRDRSILLDGKPITGPGPRFQFVNYVVLDRQTLERVAGGYVPAYDTGLQKLGTIIDGYTGLQEYLVVINWDDFNGLSGGLEPVRNQLDSVLQKIGAQKLTDSQRQRITDSPEPGSAVGVAGAPAGSAFVTVGHPTPLDCVFGPCDARETVGGMSGSLRMNSVIGKYDFVFTDYVDIDTETNQTPTENSPANSRSRSATRATPSRTPAVASRASTS